MSEIIKALEKEREKMKEEAKKYPTGDKWKTYYIGCSIGLSKAITTLEKQGQ